MPLLFHYGGQKPSESLQWLLKSIIIQAVQALTKLLLEYNITLPFIEKTERKSCSIREHIIDILMVSERDFDNVSCVWSCNVYPL